MTGHARISLAAWGATVLGALVLTPVFSGPFLFVSAFLCGAITGVGSCCRTGAHPGSSYRSCSWRSWSSCFRFFFLRTR